MPNRSRAIVPFSPVNEDGSPQIAQSPRTLGSFVRGKSLRNTNTKHGRIKQRNRRDLKAEVEHRMHADENRCAKRSQSEIAIALADEDAAGANHAEPGESRQPSDGSGQAPPRGELKKIVVRLVHDVRIEILRIKRVSALVSAETKPQERCVLNHALGCAP